MSESHSELILLYNSVPNNGTITLLINGEECGNIQTPSVLRMISASGMQIGQNNLSAVSDYKVPFKFKGTIKKVNFKLLRYKPTSDDKQNRFNADMASQWYIIYDKWIFFYFI